MLLCTPEHLHDDLKPDSWREYAAPLRGGEVITLAQLSDVHIDPTERPYVPTEFADQMYRRIHEWAKSLDEPNADQISALVLSGDFVDAARCSYVAKDNPAGKKVNEKDVAEKFVKFHIGTLEYAAESLTKLAILLKLDPQRSVLAIPGNHDLYRDGNMLPDGKPSRASHYLATVGKRFVYTPDELEMAPHLDIARRPRLCLLYNDFAAIAIVGIDSNHAEYVRGNVNEVEGLGLVSTEQLRHLEETVRRLQDSIRDLPLYIVVVLHHHLLPVEDYNPYAGSPTQRVLASTTLDSRAVISTLQQLRVQLALHGHMHHNFVQDVSYLSTEKPAIHIRPVSLISCPAFATKQPDSLPGGLLLRIDVVRGLAQAHLFLNSTRDGAQSRVGVQLGCESSNRISHREARLYRELHAWLYDKPSPARNSQILPPCSEADPDRLKRYRDAVTRYWGEDGFSLVCGATKAVDPPNVPFPLTPERWAGERDRYGLVLLLKQRDGHTYILLNNHTSLQKDDFGRWDTLLLPAFGNLSEFFRHLKWDLLRARDQLSVEASKTVSDRTSLQRAVDEVLLTYDEDKCFEVEREIIPIRKGEFCKFSPTEARPKCHEPTLVCIPRFAATPDPSAGTATTSLSDVLNLVPVVDNPADLDCGAIRHEPARQRPDVKQLGPGLVWFRLTRQRGGDLDSWKSCRALTTRNADMLGWAVETILDIRKRNGGELPDWLVHERLRIGTKFHPIRSIISFDEAALIDGLKKVRCIAGYDLEDSRPYLGTSVEFEFVRLNRERDGTIRVLGEGNNDLGLLLPTQRYVLDQGLSRAAELADAIRSHDHDPFDVRGYLKLELHTGARVAHLPPVIETIGGRERQFLLCDGNHRVVQHCWMAGEAVTAVLVRNPTQPYYAEPYLAHDWEITAGNRVTRHPDIYSRYTPRPVPDNIMQDDRFKVVPRNRRFRRYYRDFNTGFGYVGGQAGLAY